jgi:hypothetical protein
MALYSYGPRRAERQVAHPVLPPAFTFFLLGDPLPIQTGLYESADRPPPRFWFFVAFAACQRIGGPLSCRGGERPTAEAPVFFKKIVGAKAPG